MLLVTEGSTEELLFIDTRGDVIESASSSRRGESSDSEFTSDREWEGPALFYRYSVFTGKVSCKV